MRPEGADPYARIAIATIESEGAMYQTFGMLGREHEADLEREAAKSRRGAMARSTRPSRSRPRARSRTRQALTVLRSRLALLLR
jgi:hypothetical protein